MDHAWRQHDSTYANLTGLLPLRKMWVSHDSEDTLKILWWVYYKAVKVIATLLQNVTSDKKIESKFCCADFNLMCYTFSFCYLSVFLFSWPLFLCSLQLLLLNISRFKSSTPANNIHCHSGLGSGNINNAPKHGTLPRALLFLYNPYNNWWQRYCLDCKQSVFMWA